MAKVQAKEPSPAQLAARAAGAARLSAASKLRSVPHVAKGGKERDATYEQIGQPRSAQIALEGPATIDRDDIEIVSGPKFASKAATEAFMAEMVTVMIYPSSEKYPEDPVQLAVNGRQVFVQRNKPTVMKRCYVYQLARAKNEGITQDPGNPDPAVANKLNISAGLRYPFSVIHDPSRNGHAWLQQVLASA